MGCPQGLAELSLARPWGSGPFTQRGFAVTAARPGVTRCWAGRKGWLSGRPPGSATPFPTSSPGHPLDSATRTSHRGQAIPTPGYGEHGDKSTARRRVSAQSWGGVTSAAPPAQLRRRASDALPDASQGHRLRSLLGPTPQVSSCLYGDRTRPPHEGTGHQEPRYPPLGVSIDASPLAESTNVDRCTARTPATPCSLRLEQARVHAAPHGTGGNVTAASLITQWKPSRPLMADG